MAEYAVVTTNAEEKAIAFVISQISPPPTAAEFIQAQVSGALAGYVDLFDKTQASNLGDLYSKASAEDQAAVDAILKKK